MLELTIILGLILGYKLGSILRYNVVKYSTGRWRIKIYRVDNLTLITFYKWTYFSNADEYIKRLDHLNKFAKEDPEGFQEFIKKTLGK